MAQLKIYHQTTRLHQRILKLNCSIKVKNKSHQYSPEKENAQLQEQFSSSTKTQQFKKLNYGNLPKIQQKTIKLKSNRNII